MSWLETVILGLVQGLTEFIPVSSSGHIELVQRIIGERGENFHLFLEMINIGTLLALLIFFRKRILRILHEIFRERNLKMMTNLIITSVPAGVLGLALSNIIENNPFFSSTMTIGIMLGAVGILMILADKLPSLSKLKNEDELTKPRALMIGLAQVLALIPGTSRSGSTIVAGRMMGLNSKAAAEYSFLASIPIMLGVVLKTFLSGGSRAYVAENWPVVIISNLVAFISGIIALKLVMRFLQKPGTLKYFGYYRLVISAIVLALVFLA